MQAQDVRTSIAAIVEQGEPLWLTPGGTIIEDGTSLLPQLVTIDALILALKQTRLAVLKHERLLGTSWSRIEETTGTHASTWRFRHNREVLGA